MTKVSFVPSSPISLLPPDEPVGVDVPNSGQVNVPPCRYVEATLFLQNILNNTMLDMRIFQSNTPPLLRR